MNIGHISTAMVTPFQTDGSIDYIATEKLIEHLLSTGTDSLSFVEQQENLQHYQRKRNLNLLNL